MPQGRPLFMNIRITIALLLCATTYGMERKQKRRKVSPSQHELILENACIPLGITNDAGMTLLHIAAQHGQTSLCEYLLTSGADKEQRDYEGKTALMWAASQGHTTTVRLLIDAGAKINACDDEQTTALMHAALEGHKDVCKILLLRGADLSLTDEYGHTALTHACQSMEIATCTTLIRHASFLPPLPSKSMTNESIRRLLTALLSFKRIQQLPSDIQHLIFQSNTELRHDLTTIGVSQLYNHKADLIPVYYHHLIRRAITEETMKRLKPLLREALLYAHDETLLQILDDTHLEEQFGDALKKTHEKLLTFLTSRT